MDAQILASLTQNVKAVIAALARYVPLSRVVKVPIVASLRLIVFYP